jgi:hypothetical protein
MTTHELLELAALDALGLLEDDERDAFDKAFRAAAPALQAQIRREQTRIAKDESMLPEVTPPIGLKARVLAAWREAVETLKASPAGVRRHGAGRFIPPLLPSRGVTPVWRAVAIGCSAAAIVLGFATYQMKAEFERVTLASNANFVDEVMRREFGPNFKRLVYSGKTQIVQFKPTAPDARGEAVVLFDAERKVADFFCRQLPADGNYQLVLLDEKGQVVKDSKWTCVVRTPDGPGSEYHQKIEGVGLEKGQTLAIMSTSPQGNATYLLRQVVAG